MSEKSDKKKILVCCGTGCIANNSLEIYKKFNEKLINSDVDVEPTIKATGCNGLCEKGPVVKILPDDISYFKVSVDDVDEIIEKTIKNNSVIDRLLYFDTNEKKKIKSYKDATFYKPQHKLALRNIGEIDPLKIEDYIERGGYEALHKVLFKMNSNEVITEIELSQLRGRGGAGFPTGNKWRTCSSLYNFPKYVVCNGDEGDPGAFMDRSIMEGDPNTIIEGMIICGYAIDSHKGFLYIRNEYELARKNMQVAIDSALKHRYLGNNILNSGFDFDLEIVRGGGAFVCGESSALMSSIEGNTGEPRAKYIRSVEKGLWNQPTILNNVETWANIPPIILNGSNWFKSIGIENNSGTKVFSLVGKVKNTGLVEVPMGTKLSTLVFEIGGGIIKDRPFKAVQTGGPSGGCIPKEQLDVSLDFDSLSRIGSMMGSGGVIVMDDTTCMVDLAKYYMEFLSEESCGKCTTCREGINTLLKILTNITEGKGELEDIDLLLQLSETIRDASLCGLGKTSPNPVVTSIQYFRDEYVDHIVNKKCSAGVCKNLTRYYIEQSTCIGCGLCKRKCPVNAIVGNKKEPHIIDLEKCIKCGSCYNNCPTNAVKIGGVV
jgi:NADH-quinone oxidoreductase subunit F